MIMTVRAKTSLVHISDYSYLATIGQILIMLHYKTKLSSLKYKILTLNSLVYSNN